MSGSFPQREETEREASLRLNVTGQTLFSLTSPISDDFQRINGNLSSGLVGASGSTTCGPSTFSRRGGAGGGGGVSLPHVVPSSRTVPTSTISGRLGVARYIKMIFLFPSVLRGNLCFHGNQSTNLDKNLIQNDPLNSPSCDHHHHQQHERHFSPTSITLLPELVIRHHDAAEGIVPRRDSTQEGQSAMASAGGGALCTQGATSRSTMVVKFLFWILGFLSLLAVSGTVEYIMREQRDHPEAGALGVLIDLGRWVVEKTSPESSHVNPRKKSGGRSSGADSFMSYLDEDEEVQERKGKESTKGGSGGVVNNNQNEASSSSSYSSSSSTTAGLGVLFLRRIVDEYIERLDNNYSFGIDANGEVYREEKTKRYPITNRFNGAVIAEEGAVAGEPTPAKTKGATSQKVPPFSSSSSSSSSSLLFIPDKDFPSLPLSLPAWPRPFGLTEANEMRLPAGRLMRRMLGSENSIDDYDYDHDHAYDGAEWQSPTLIGTKEVDLRAGRGGGGGRGLLPKRWCFSRRHTHHWYSVWRKRLSIEQMRAVSAYHNGRDLSLASRVLGGGALSSSSSLSSLSSSLLGLPTSTSTSYLYREVLAESGLLLGDKRGEEGIVEVCGVDMAASIAILAEAFQRYGSGDSCEGRRSGAKKEAYPTQNASGVGLFSGISQRMRVEADVRRGVPAYATICGNKDAPILASHFASFHNISLGRFVLILNTHEPKWVALCKFLEELFPQRFIVEYAMVMTRALWEGQREYRRRHNGSFGIPKRNYSRSGRSLFAAFSPAKTKALFAKEDAKDDALDDTFERIGGGSGDAAKGTKTRRIFSTRLYRWHLRNFHPDLLSGVRTLAPMHSVSMGWNRIAHLCFRGANPVSYVTIANGDFYLIGDELGDYSAYVASMVSAGEKHTIDDHGEDGEGADIAKGRRGSGGRSARNMAFKKGGVLPTKSNPAVLGGYQDTLLFSFISYTFRGWQRFGEFDESFFPMYAEDNEFHERIRSAGYEVFPSYDKVCLARGNRKRGDGGGDSTNKSDAKKGDEMLHRRQISYRDEIDDGGAVSTMIVGGPSAGSRGRRMDRNRRFEFVHYHHVGSLSRDKKNRAQSDLLDVLRSSQSHGYYRYYKYMAQPDPKARHNFYPTFSSPFNNPSISHRNSWAIDARYRRCLLDPKAFPSRICRMDVRIIQELLLGTYRYLQTDEN